MPMVSNLREVVSSFFDIMPLGAKKKVLLFGGESIIKGRKASKNGCPDFLVPCFCVICESDSLHIRP